MSTTGFHLRGARSPMASKVTRGALFRGAGSLLDMFGTMHAFTRLPDRARTGPQRDAAALSRDGRAVVSRLRHEIDG